MNKIALWILSMYMNGQPNEQSLLVLNHSESPLQFRLNISKSHLKYPIFITKTRMHSSRMRTTCSMTVSCSIRWGGYRYRPPPPLKIITNMCDSDTFSRNCEYVRTYWPFAVRVPFCRPSSVRSLRRNHPARPWWWRSVHQVEAAAQTLSGLAARSETTQMNEWRSERKNEWMDVQKKTPFTCVDGVI